MSALAPSLHWRGAIACAAVGLAALGAAQSGPGRSLLHDAGVAGAAERYTELSFTRPSKLPTRLPAGHRVNVSYALRNLEGERRDYRWAIVAGGARLAHGATNAAAGERVVIRRSVVTPCQGKRTRVEVRLAQPRQAIGFWAACS